MEGAQGTHKASKLASEDVISSMPENVITNIMNRLPIRVAVRTCVLARNWRLKWTLLTQLVFDTEISESSVTLRGAEGKKYYDSRIISRLLLLLKGPVTKFALSIPCDKRLDFGDLNHWVLFLAGKGIKEFTLINHHHIPLRLPIHLFSCLELTHLKLENCLFHPSPTFCGFPDLLSLDLRMVCFESGKCGEFITLCPILEILEIDAECRRISTSKVNMDDIAKLKNLKKLTLSLHELENRKITISNIFQFLGSLSELEKLHLDFSSCEFVVEAIAWKWVYASFPCLKTLTLVGVNTGSSRMLVCAFLLFWFPPNLQELRIVMSRYTVAFASDVSQAALFSYLNSDSVRRLQLRSVVIDNFRGSKNEICLMKCLLACSPFLKRLVVCSLPSLVSDEKLRVAMELLKFHRASTIAQVVFS